MLAEMQKSPFVTLPLILAVAISLSTYAQTQRSVRPPRKTRLNPKDGLIYLSIPPGKYEMGCSFDDSKCSIYEEPEHQVTVAKAFWLGQTPVTQAAYTKVTGINPSHFKGDQLPVESVNWDEAKAYCELVGMRLPTEAEWEYAGRGGNPSALYGPLARIAWYKANSGGRTHRVAQKRPNGYGLYDMLGNVDEWVADFYSVYTNDDAADASLPKNPSLSTYVPPVKMLSRVVRGASWDNDAYFVSVSNRMRYDPANHHQNIGFRCAAN